MALTNVSVLDAIGQLIEAKEDRDEFPQCLHMSDRVLNQVREEAYLDTRQCYVEFNGWGVLWGLPIFVCGDPSFLVEVVI